MKMSLRGECHSSVRIEHSFLPFSSTPSIRILILLQDTLSPSTSSLFHPLTCSLPHVILPNPILESSTSFFPHPSFALSLHLSSSVLSENERYKERERERKKTLLLPLLHVAFSMSLSPSFYPPTFSFHHHDPHPLLSKSSFHFIFFSLLF